MPDRRRQDLDELAARLRADGVPYRPIAVRLGCSTSMARRRVIRHERKLREAEREKGRSRRAQA